MVFGFTEGSTEVAATDENVTAENSVAVSVLPGDSDRGGGSRYPRVLVSEIDPDPDTGEDVTLSPDDPPVHQRVHDVKRNILWINSDPRSPACILADRSGLSHTSGGSITSSNTST